MNKKFTIQGFKIGNFIFFQIYKGLKFIFFQIYKGLDIVSAKAAPQERALVPHHCIDYVQPYQTYTALDFRNKAVAIVSFKIKVHHINKSASATDCCKASIKLSPKYNNKYHRWYLNDKYKYNFLKVLSIYSLKISSYWGHTAVYVTRNEMLLFNKIIIILVRYAAKCSLVYESLISYIITILLFIF